MNEQEIIQDILNAMTPTASKLRDIPDGTVLEIVNVSVMDSRFGKQPVAYTRNNEKIYLPTVYLEWAQRIVNNPEWRSGISNGAHFQKVTTTGADGREYARLQAVNK